MTVDFINEERPILEKEKRCHQPYIGYIAPNGDLIDFNKPFGESGHDGWDNIVTNAFLQFVSYSVKSTSISNPNSNISFPNDIDSLKYPNLDENIIRGIRFIINKNTEDFDTFLNDLNRYLKYKPSDNNQFLFRYNLLSFFKNAYTNRTFFETIGRKIEVISKETFLLRNPHLIKQGDQHLQNKSYLEYLKKELMSCFKDIAIMYLGYDSIERFQPNGKVIKIPYDPREYGSWTRPYSSYFYYTPRIITTSDPNINERFFNHLAMNWEVHVLPRYYWNEQTQRYEIIPFLREFYNNEREENLRKEIEAIKRLVPLKERYKYFR